jgi:hypothetical protein
MAGAKPSLQTIDHPVKKYSGTSALTFASAMVTKKRFYNISTRSTSSPSFSIMKLFLLVTNGGSKKARVFDSLEGSLILSSKA